MQAVGLLWRRSQPLLYHKWDEFPHAICDSLIAEVVHVRPILFEGFRQSEDRIDMGVCHRLRLCAREVSQLDAQIADRLPVADGRSLEDADVQLDELHRIL